MVVAYTVIVVASEVTSLSSIPTDTCLPSVIVTAVSKNWGMLSGCAVK